MDPAPLDQPLSYPGARAPWSFRLYGGAVTRFDGPVPRDRTPVLAIGSNASPAQLAAKFHGRPDGAGVGDGLIGLVVSVDGVQVRPSAHLGRSGYWPFAPMVSPQAGQAVLCLLDDAQLEVLDRTEPNYDRRRLDPRTHRVTGVPDEVCAAGAWVYVSRHGVVDDPRLPAWGDPPPDQTALLTALGRLVPVPRRLATPAALSAALRQDPALAAELTAEVKEHLVVRDAGLAVVDG